MYHSDWKFALGLLGVFSVLIMHSDVSRGLQAEESLSCLSQGLLSSCRAGVTWDPPCTPCAQWNLPCRPGTLCYQTCPVAFWLGQSLPPSGPETGRTGAVSERSPSSPGDSLRSTGARNCTLTCLLTGSPWRWCWEGPTQPRRIQLFC